MDETGFLPSPSLIPRIAPTEDRRRNRPGPFAALCTTPQPLHGWRRRDAGLFHYRRRPRENAPCFSTWARQRPASFSPGNGQEIHFAPPVPRSACSARLGWDIDSPYSSNRGELFPIGLYGHTGFTGTSCGWIPTSQSFVIVLTTPCIRTRPLADFHALALWPRLSRRVSD